MADRLSKVILSNGTAEVIEKKSRFIGNLYKVADEQEVSAHIASIKKQYWDARHHCYAFILGENGGLQRCSDDGEPAGTAGKPILEVLDKSGLHNALLVVTRYFGGTLLGTGGLVRAYGQTAKLAIENAVTAFIVEAVRVSVITDYGCVGGLQYMAQKEKLLLLDGIYTDRAEIILAFEKERLDAVLKQIEQITKGQGELTVDDDFLLGSDCRSGELFALEK